MFGPEEHGKAFLGAWGRWMRFDEALDGVAGRWSIGHASQGIVLLLMADDRMRLDVVGSFEEATARGWPPSLWDGIKHPDVSLPEPAPAHVSPLPPPGYRMPALRVIDDDRGAEAVEIVRREGKASVSMLQRKMSIGHARAARLIDLMERVGIVGPSGPGGLREVYEQPATGNADSDQ